MMRLRWVSMRPNKPNQMKFGSSVTWMGMTMPNDTNPSTHLRSFQLIRVHA